MGTIFKMIELFVGDLALMVIFYREILEVEIDWDFMLDPIFGFIPFIPLETLKLIQAHYIRV